MRFSRKSLGYKNYTEVTEEYRQIQRIQRIQRIKQRQQKLIIKKAISIISPIVYTKFLDLGLDLSVADPIIKKILSEFNRYCVNLLNSVIINEPYIHQILLEDYYQIQIFLILMNNDEITGLVQNLITI